MKKIWMLCLCWTLLWGQTAFAQSKEVKASPTTTVKQTIEEKEAKLVPVSFAVLDFTGEVDAAIYKDWKQQVRQAYHVPYYSLKDDDVYRAAAGDLLGRINARPDKLPKDFFAQLAQENDVAVVTLMLIHRMDQHIIQGMWHWHDGPETYVRTYTSADLYVYRVDQDKLLKKSLRDVSTKEIGMDEKPERVIKYAMRRLVNEMENRPQI